MREIEHRQRPVADLIELMLDPDAHRRACRTRHEIRVQVADARLEHALTSMWFIA